LEINKMAIKVFIISVFLLIACLVSFIVSVLFYLKQNQKLTGFIKRKDYKLWQNYRENVTIGIPLPILFIDPNHIKHTIFKKNEKNVKIRNLVNRAIVSIKYSQICFGLTIGALLICIVTGAVTKIL